MDCNYAWNGGNRVFDSKAGQSGEDTKIKGNAWPNRQKCGSDFPRVE